MKKSHPSTAAAALARKKREQGELLTMADLAKLAGISKITVSRALGDSALVNPKTRAHVRAIAKEYGYKLNVSARNLRLRRSQTIAVIVEMKPSADRSMSDPYPLELLGGISQELTSVGYSILLTTRQGASAPAVQAADGVILLGQGVREDAVHMFDKLQLPMVVWGAQQSGDAHVVVGSNNRQGGARVAERFVAIGRRHPVFLGDTDHTEIAERYAGFVDALSAHGLAPVAVRRKAFTLAGGVEAIQKLAASERIHFDAIFACNDLLAMGAIRALTELGMRVPEDVSVIGYDDTPLGANFIPPLSSVHQNWRDGGILLAQKVLALIRGETTQSEMLPSTLVVRAT